ncbi:hypothetical protein NUW58_g4501 [Xylaria curta]|uniref:Uncharacterized protein n=1 Tax=Xylaria curta TaxID=42375 RepID=A0ACC1P8T9_9PEZI|nr:hypothetical protein NUW58_g4501 [Xylaria curta]
MADRPNPFRNNANPQVVDDGNLSKEFRLGPRLFRDDSLMTIFVHCRGESCKPPTQLFRALAYAFEPSMASEKQRRQWIQSSFVLNLKLGSQRLPQELALLTVQYCIREYAIAAAWLRIAEPNTYSVDITSGIWAFYVIIDGVQYFASFANESSANAQLILSSKKAANAQRMYVAEDHLGIRQVHIGNSTLPVLGRSTPRLWWRTFSVHGGARLRVHTDGIKIRHFECIPCDEISRLARNISWLTPEHRPDLVRFHSLTSTSPAQLQMTSLICNDPRTTAYSACWDSPILYLHAHRVGESLAFYNDVVERRKNAVWLYMPKDEGEYISQIWKRSRRLTRELALLIMTNKGRVMMVGPQPPPFWPPCNWTLLHRSNGASSRIFFDISTFGIHKLGFELPEPVSQGQSPSIPIPSSPYPESTSLDDYLYTSALLESVIELTPCKRKVAGRSFIAGLLFRYSDGTQASVGEFRLDCVATPMAVDSSSDMWLTFDTKDGYPFVDGTDNVNYIIKAKQVYQLGREGNL